MSAGTGSWYTPLLDFGHDVVKDGGYIEQAYNSTFSAGADDWGNLTDGKFWKGVGETAGGIAPLAEAGLSYLAAKEENALTRDKNNMLKAQYDRQANQQDTANNNLEEGFNMAFYGQDPNGKKKKVQSQGLAGTLAGAPAQAISAPAIG